MKIDSARPLKYSTILTPIIFSLGLLLPELLLAAPSFGGRKDYTVGSWPTQACSADFNGDSWPDIAVSNYVSSTISILTNNGDGTFHTSATHNVGSAPLSISTADFDEDGDYDLVFTNAVTNNYISVMLNTGGGSFAAPVPYTVGTYPHHLYIADLDGDNDLDIAVSCYNAAGRVYILLNNGNGTFLAGGDYPAGSFPTSVFAGDFDGDSDNDLAVTNSFSNTVSIFLNNGVGTYQPAMVCATSSIPHSVYGADFDGDTYIDLAVANHDASTVSIFRNNGNAIFSLLENYPVGSLPRHVASADLDGDQDYDLAVSAYGESNVTILINDGTGVFQSGGVYALGVSGSSPAGICVADLDKDGDKDLVFGYTSGDFITVLFNTTSQPCKFGNALQFDGNDDEVVVPDNASLNFSPGQSMTVECWFKVTQTPGTFHILGRRSSCAGTMNYQIAISVGQLFFSSPGNSQVTTAFVPVLNQWYHVAGTYDGSTPRLYINGAEQGTQSGSSSLNDSAPLKIGGSADCSHFAGQIDEVRISDVVRTPSEFCLTGECTPDANTVALWHFNEASGTTASDASGHNYSGTIYGATHQLCADPCGDIGFRPNPDGWQFNNAAGNMWPPSWWQQFSYGQYPYPFLWRFFCKASDFPDWPLFVAAFGNNQCYYDPPPGWVIYRPSAVAKWFRLKGAWGGSCFGFAISSFLFFNGYLDVSSVFPGSASLYSVPIDDVSRQLVNKYFLYQFGRVSLENDKANLNTTPTQTLEACKTMFGSSVRDDRAITLYNNHGSGAHTINPYRCEQDQLDPATWYIYVYDNNYPNDATRRISVNTSINTWSYDALSSWGGAKKLYLELPSSSHASSPRLPKSIPPRDQWKTSGLVSPGMLSTHTELYLSSADTTTLQSAIGAIGQIGDSLFNTLEDGIPIIPKNGLETPPIGYFLPNATWQINASGIQDSVIQVSLFADSIAILYSRRATLLPQTESIVYHGADSSICVMNPSGFPRTYQIDVISVKPDSEIVCGVRDISITLGDSARYSLTAQSGMQVDNFGPARSYTLRLEVAGINGDTVFYCEGVTIPGNSSQRILPDWRSHGDTLMILVDSGMVGTFSDTIFVQNAGEIHVCGDADANGFVNISDAVYLIAYIFSGGPAPNPVASGDADCNGFVNISDAVYLINYIFGGGAAPCAGCK